MEPMSSTSAKVSPLSKNVEKMLDKIVAAPRAFFKSQQNGEPDLSDDEKRSICEELYFRRPDVFLSRYRQFLSAGDAICFRDCRVENEETRYEMEFYLRDLKKTSSSEEEIHASESMSNEASTVKNRRYAALKKLVDEGEFFSDSAMRERDPLFFDHMIGRYQTESEQWQSFHSGDEPGRAFSSVLLGLYDAKEISNRRRQQEYEARISSQNFREHGDDDEEEEEMESENSGDETAGVGGPKQPKISDAEKRDLREEFVREMHERFLDGRDVDFDYREVDENSRYDMLDVIEKDDQDKYFDAEQPENEDGNLQTGPVTGRDQSGVKHAIFNTEKSDDYDY